VVRLALLARPPVLQRVLAEVRHRARSPANRVHQVPRALSIEKTARLPVAIAVVAVPRMMSTRYQSTCSLPSSA